MQREDIAHALLEKRLIEAWVSIEYKDASLFKDQPVVVDMTEPLHDQTAYRLIEAVENLARRIAHGTKGDKHCTLVCTPIRFSSTDIKMTVFELKATE